jgi:hypothetical protein
MIFLAFTNRYFSTIAAVIGGPTSLNHGIEVNEECCRFSVERCSAFKAQYADSVGGVADIKVVHGNVFDMKELLEGAMVGGCECYDRIYVGAACPASLKDKLLRSLSLGGVLVAPVGDELLKVRRVDILDDANFATPPPHGRHSSTSSGSSMSADDESQANFAASFSIALLSGVRFVELTPSTAAASTWNHGGNNNSQMVEDEEQRSRASSMSSEATDATSRSDGSESSGPLVKRRAQLPTPLWSPQTHVVFPMAFKRSAFALMIMTTSVRFAESLPGRLPRALLLHLLSFTSR